MIYVHVEDRHVVNRLIVDDSDEGRQYAKDHGWIGPLDGMDPEPQIGWTYDGRRFHPPKEPAE